jgi:hypothetical protein
MKLQCVLGFPDPEVVAILAVTDIKRGDGGLNGVQRTRSALDSSFDVVSVFVYYAEGVATGLNGLLFSSTPPGTTAFVVSQNMCLIIPDKECACRTCV